MLYLWGLIRCKRAANDAQHRRWVSLPLGEAGLAVRFQFYQSRALMMMSYLGSPCPPKLLLQESTWAKVRPYGAIALAPSGVWILAQSTIRTARCPRSLERATQSSAKAQKVTLSRFSSHHLPFSPVRGPKEVTLLVGARRCDLALATSTPLHPHTAQGGMQSHLDFVLDIEVGILRRMAQNGLNDPLFSSYSGSFRAR